LCYSSTDDYVCDLGVAGADPLSSPSGVNDRKITAEINTVALGGGEPALVVFSATPDREITVNEFAIRKGDTYIAYCYIKPGIRLLPGVKQDILVKINPTENMSYLGVSIGDLSDY